MNSYTITRIDDKDLGSAIGRCAGPWEDIAKLICKHNWSPSLFYGTKRIAKDFESTQLLVLDVDEGCSLDRAKDLFKDYQHIIATTKSHLKEKNNKICDRFRVIIVLDRAITKPEDYLATWKEAQHTWDFIDPACKDLARFYFPCVEVVSVNNQGLLRVALDAPAKPVAPTVQPIAQEDKGDLFKSTLDFLVNGAPRGQWHTSLIKATMDLREQGYTQDETVEKVTNIMGYVEGITMLQIANIYKRDLKYDHRPKFDPETITRDDFIQGVDETPVSVTALELFDDCIEYLSDKEMVAGEPTGLPELDKLLGGGRRLGELTVLMAHAKTGKNSLYHYLLYHSLSKGLSFGYASRELDPATEVIPNLLSIAMGTNAWKSDIDADYKDAARKLVTNWPLHFAPGYGYFALDSMEQWFRHLKQKGVDYFMFDHFHHALDVEDHNSTTRLIKKLKTLTKELNIHLDLIVQPRSLGRDEKLNLNTLRGGSAIGQCLDNLLILERYAHPTFKNLSRLKLEVARHKLATPGKVYLQYDPITTCFKEFKEDRAAGGNTGNTNNVVNIPVAE